MKTPEEIAESVWRKGGPRVSAETFNAGMIEAIRLDRAQREATQTPGQRIAAKWASETNLNAWWNTRLAKLAAMIDAELAGGK